MKIPLHLLVLCSSLSLCHFILLIVILALDLGVSSTHAISYPANNSTNFPSGTYDDGNATALNYRYFVPVNYDANDATTLYPLVLFLHGNGQKGTDNNKQLGNNANGGMIFISTGPDNQSEFPCFWVAPQCSASDWEYEYVPAQLEGMLDDLIASYHIDPDRIYITGLSMGGGGVTSQLAAYPNRYAAANPNAGWYNGNGSVYAHVPLWAFHCANDGTVGVNGSDTIVSEMRKYGGTPIYTRYDTGGHSGAWGRAYTSTPLVEWMMSQRRGQQPASLVGPYVKVTSPTDTGNTSTSANSLLIGGVADTDTTRIWYRNNQFYNNVTPTVSGTASWSVTVDPLRISSTGKENEIYIEAETIAFGDPGNGLTTTNDILVINGISGGDAIQPDVAITSPTSNATYTTSNSLISISGTASDSVGVTSLTWSSSSGASGSITPGATWQLNDVSLQAGSNVITITARDAANNVGSDTITVTRSAENSAPVANAGTSEDSPIIVGGTISVDLIGSAVDDGLPEDGGPLAAEWTMVSGPGSVTFVNDMEFETIATFTVAGSYVLRLTVDDGELTGSNEVSITVQPEGTSPPVVYPLASTANFPSGSYDDGSATALQYRYFVPENYDASDSEILYPLVLFLHGSGEKGTDNTRQLDDNANGAMIFVSTANPDNQQAFPCFWVAPQCQLSDWKTSYLPAQIQGMLDDLIANYHIDPARIYITGVSMGGQGVVGQIDSYPDRYAAANPIAGSVPGSNANSYAHVPLWAFHCADDVIAGINGSDLIAGQMRSAGGKPIYTRYDTGGHAASWIRAYSTETPLVPWMMAQRLDQEPAFLAGPHVRVTSPTTSGYTATADSSLLLSGVADAGTTVVRYRNSQYYNNVPPTVNGTINWNVIATPLRGDRINEIYIEADTAAYAALGNGKTTTNDYVTISTLRYDIWAETNGLELGDNSELELNPDGDSLNNFLEYAFGLDPTEFNRDGFAPENPLLGSYGLPKLIKSGDGGVQFVFARRVDYAAAQLTYTVQFSDDMQNWADSSVIPIVMVNDGDVDIVEVSDPLFAPENAENRFLRISVESGN